MIVIDTHIFIWWVNNSSFLKKNHRSFLDKQVDGAILLNIISLWEIAKAVEKGNLELNISVEKWLNESVENYNISIVSLDIPIVVESTRLPGNFHKDPADQLIVATSRVLDIPLLTEDEKILKYPFVKLFGSTSFLVGK